VVLQQFVARNTDEAVRGLLAQVFLGREGEPLEVLPGLERCGWQALPVEGGASRMAQHWSEALQLF
jgi:hypothetical protein